MWKGGRAVECTGLENRRSSNAPASSNLAPSAGFLYLNFGFNLKLAKICQI